MLELHIWRESYWNWYWYCIMQKFGIVIGTAIAKFSQNVLILLLLLQREAAKYWYWYWYCRLEATTIDIDIELKFSLSHSPDFISFPIRESHVKGMVHQLKFSGDPKTWNMYISRILRTFEKLMRLKSKKDTLRQLWHVPRTSFRHHFAVKTTKICP